MTSKNVCENSFRLFAEREHKTYPLLKAMTITKKKMTQKELNELNSSLPSICLGRTELYIVLSVLFKDFDFY